MPRTRTRATRKKKVYFKASIGRFNGDYKAIAFKEGDRVSDVLSRAHLTLNSGDEINDDMGNTVTPNDNAKETTYHVVGNYKNGKLE